MVYIFSWGFLIPTARYCFGLVCNVVVFDIFFFVDRMSHQNQYQPDLCVRVIAAAAARGCDGRTGARGAVSRFVPFISPGHTHAVTGPLYSVTHFHTHI